jgi:molecular chaperone GrpE (heat shock protein)
MLEKLNAKLKEMLSELDMDEKKVYTRIQKSFNEGKVYCNCGTMDDMEELMVAKAKQDAIYDILDIIEDIEKAEE